MFCEIRLELFVPNLFPSAFFVKKVKLFTAVVKYRRITSRIISVQTFYCYRRSILPYSRTYTHACIVHLLILTRSSSGYIEDIWTTQTFRRYALSVEFARTLSFLMSSISVCETALIRHTLSSAPYFSTACFFFSAYNYSSLYPTYSDGIDQTSIQYNVTN